MLAVRVCFSVDIPGASRTSVLKIPSQQCVRDDQLFMQLCFSPSPIENSLVKVLLSSVYDYSSTAN